MEKLVVHTEEPPMGYGSLGFFRTKAKAEEWAKAARKARKMYPFWLQKKYAPGIDKDKDVYVLWWMKPKNSKMVGKGFK